jgi:hypothetical protein
MEEVEGVGAEVVVVGGVVGGVGAGGVGGGDADAGGVGRRTTMPLNSSARRCGSFDFRLQIQMK